MNTEHYHRFLCFQDAGQKKQATKPLRHFIASFEDSKDIEKWVWANLNQLATNTNAHSRIRHEIFCELVYPTLKAGYGADDFTSTLWLAKLSQNLYQAPNIHQELAWVSEMALLYQCHALKPTDNEASRLLLKGIVKFLQYSEHEWPSGILYGKDGATLAQCEEIAAEVELALSLDKNTEYTVFLKRYTKKLAQYQAELKQKKLKR